MDSDEKRAAEEHIERLIDEALEETFPASDPPSPAVDARSDASRGKKARPPPGPTA
jgi:hypothetical protein